MRSLGDWGRKGGEGGVGICVDVDMMSDNLSLLRSIGESVSTS